MVARRVLIIHPDAERRRALRAALEGTEVVEAESRQAAVPLLAQLDPAVVFAHPEGFKKLLRDLERHAPGAVRAVLCPPGDEALKRSLVDVAAEGYDFVSLEEGALDRVRALVSPRGSGRFVPQRPLVGHFNVGPTRFLCQVREIGNDGLGLSVSTSMPIDLLIPGVKLTEAWIERDGMQVFEARSWLLRTIRKLGASEHAMYLGVSFEAGEHTSNSGMTAIADPVRVRGLIRRAVAHGEPLNVAFVTGAEQLEFEALALSEEVLRLRKRNLSLDHPFSPPDIVRIDFELNGVAYEGLAPVVESEFETLEIVVPGFLHRRHRRRTLRIHCTPEHPAFITFTNPLSGAVTTRPLLDLHPDGAAFEVDTSAENLPPGMVVPEVGLETAGLSITCSAVVQGTSGGWRGDSVWTRRCGLRLTGLNEADRHALIDATLQTRSPEIIDGGSVDFSAIWEMFKTAGVSFPDYDITDGGSAERLGEPQARLRAGPPGLGKTLLFRGPEGCLVGHSSGLRIYSGTWLPQHLLVQNGYHRGNHISKTLVGLTFDYGEALEGIEYIRGLWRLSNRWASRIYRSVTAKLIRPGLSCLTTYEPMRFPVGAPLPPCSLAARVAQPDEHQLLLNHLREHVDPVRLRADDLVEGQICMEDVSARYRRSGLERSRTIAVVEGPAGPRGWVLVEQMSPGLFWAEIYSYFQMTLVEPDAPDADEVRLALTRFGVRAAQRSGRPVAVARAAPEDRTFLERLGFSTLGPIVEFDAHRTMARDVTTQLMGVFERLDTRRRAHHGAPAQEAAAP